MYVDWPQLRRYAIACAVEQQQRVIAGERKFCDSGRRATAPAVPFLMLWEAENGLRSDLVLARGRGRAEDDLRGLGPTDPRSGSDKPGYE